MKLKGTKHCPILRVIFDHILRYSIKEHFKQRCLKQYACSQPHSALFINNFWHALYLFLSKLISCCIQSPFQICDTCVYNTFSLLLRNLGAWEMSSLPRTREISKLHLRSHTHSQMNINWSADSFCHTSFKMLKRIYGNQQINAYFPHFNFVVSELVSFWLKYIQAQAQKHISQREASGLSELTQKQFTA